MKRLVGLALEVIDNNGQPLGTDYWQEWETEKISKIALNEVKTIKKQGWKLVKISKYWAD